MRRESSAPEFASHRMNTIVAPFQHRSRVFFSYTIRMALVVREPARLKLLHGITPGFALENEQAIPCCLYRNTLSLIHLDGCERALPMDGYPIGQRRNARARELFNGCERKNGTRPLASSSSSVCLRCQMSHPTLARRRVLDDVPKVERLCRSQTGSNFTWRCETARGTASQGPHSPLGHRLFRCVDSCTILRDHLE